MAAAAGITTGRICHSGKTRARQTAEAWGQVLGAPVELAQALSPRDDPSVWTKQVTTDTGDLMLVGHMPHLGRLAGVLLADDPQRPWSPSSRAHWLACRRVRRAGRWRWCCPQARAHGRAHRPASPSVSDPLHKRLPREHLSRRLPALCCRRGQTLPRPGRTTTCHREAIWHARTSHTPIVVRRSSAPNRRPQRASPRANRRRHLPPASVRYRVVDVRVSTAVES
jgi:hypothetical protein